MKTLLIPIILLLVCFVSHGKGQDLSNKNDILKNVNVLIGTGANGNVIPVAVVPHGMVQLGPDARNSGIIITPAGMFQMIPMWPQSGKRILTGTGGF